MIAAVIVLALLGIVANIVTSPGTIVPDWGGALLIASLAARRHHWKWVFPLLLLHDALLCWSPWPLTLMMVAAGLLLTLHIDMQAGPALLQRLLMVLISLIPMWLQGWPMPSLVLSFLLILALWYWLRDMTTSPAQAASG